MTFLVKCEVCGKEQEALPDNFNWPGNPMNEETRETWVSKYNDLTKRTEHCCSYSCQKEYSKR